METLYLQIQLGWRAARSRASVVGAAALALMLAVGLSSAIFTTGGLRPMLSFAPDSRGDQAASIASKQVTGMVDEKRIAPTQEAGQPQGCEPLAQQTAPAREPRRNLSRRLLRPGNHPFVSRLLGNEAERGQ